MEAARRSVRDRCKAEHVPFQLVLNHDHVWKASYRSKARAIRKQRPSVRT
jgi:hypothetical protein